MGETVQTATTTHIINYFITLTLTLDGHNEIKFQASRFTRFMVTSDKLNPIGYIHTNMSILTPENCKSLDHSHIDYWSGTYQSKQEEDCLQGVA